MSYDPALMNTASCKSKITMLDGEQGDLHYRGYPVEQLAEQCGYLEVAYLLIHGTLPNASQLDSWQRDVMAEAMLSRDVRKIIEAFSPDANPMGILLSAVSALSASFPDANQVNNPHIRNMQMRRLIGKMPTIAGYAYRRIQRRSFTYPNQELSYTGNLLRMMFKTNRTYHANAFFERALDIMLILHADHEQNCSTSVMRTVGSSLANPYLCTAAAAAALSGVRHGAANVAVLQMLREISSKSQVPEYIKRVKCGNASLLGFGHQVYKSYDPRARIIKRLVQQMLADSKEHVLMDIALELERIVIEDEYFASQRVYPQVELFSGLVYEAIGFPAKMFPVLFSVARTSGWLAHWAEMLEDPESKKWCAVPTKNLMRL